MKKSIGLKIIISYLVVVVVSFIVLGFLFNSMVRTFLIREVENSLQKEGAVLAGVFDKVSMESIKKETAERKPTIRLANRLFEGDYFIVDLKHNIIDSSKPRLITPGTRFAGVSVNRALKGDVYKGVTQLQTKDFVVVSIPLKNQNGAVKGALVTLTELKGVQQFGTSIIRVLFRGVLIVSILAVLLGIILARSISKPVKLLEAGARKLAERNFATRINIHSGDELEQLSNSFNTMAEELEHYYLAQKKFLQNASHELKTPLMSIQGYAEGIKDHVLEGEEKEKGLEIIINESNRLTKLVNELIYLSKLETMEEVYSFEVDDLTELLFTSREKVQSLAQRKNITINVPTADRPILANVDSDKLIQAFINLFGNGIRFAVHQLDVLLHEENGEVFIEFRDDGKGFRPEELESVFDRFYMGQKGDTGLGLAITKAIIEKHGGKIKARNNYPGASIIITLPKKG